ncbi:MAG: SirB2 family protein [Methylococcales bacterium]
MLKILHVSFALLSVGTFIGRVFMENSHAQFFAQKWVKIAPHIISTILLITGFALVFQGGWLSGNYGWIVAKIIALLAYIGLGLVAVKSQGTQRWQAFAGAMACFIYILAVAGSKNPLVFL